MQKIDNITTIIFNANTFKQKFSNLNIVKFMISDYYIIALALAYLITNVEYI